MVALRKPPAAVPMARMRLPIAQASMFESHAPLL